MAKEDHAAGRSRSPAHRAPSLSSSRSSPAQGPQKQAAEKKDQHESPDRSRGPAHCAKSSSAGSSTAPPDSPTRRDDINYALIEILREPGHRYGVHVRKDGFASAIELACSPLLKDKGISLGDIRWIVDIRDRQRYQWCDIHGSSHIRLIMSRDMLPDTGGTSLFSDPTVPVRRAETVIDSKQAGKHQSASHAVEAPQDHTGNSRQHCRQIGHDRKNSTPLLRTCQNMNPLLDNAERIMQPLHPVSHSPMQAVCSRTRPRKGAATASFSGAVPQKRIELTGLLEGWYVASILGFCNVLLLILHFQATKQRRRWLMHRRIKGKYRRRPLITPFRIHDTYLNLISNRGGPKSAGPSLVSKHITSSHERGEVKVSPRPPTGERPPHANNACTSAGGKMAGGAPLRRTPNSLIIRVWMYLSCIACCMILHDSNVTQAVSHKNSVMTAAIPCPKKVPPQAVWAAYRRSPTPSRGTCCGGPQDQRPLRCRNFAASTDSREGQKHSWSGARRRTNRWSLQSPERVSQTGQRLRKIRSRIAAPLAESRKWSRNGNSAERTRVRSSTSRTWNQSKNRSPKPSRRSRQPRCARPSHRTSGDYDRVSKERRPATYSNNGRTWKDDWAKTERVQGRMDLGPTRVPMTSPPNLHSRAKFSNGAQAVLLSIGLFSIARRGIPYRAKKRPPDQQSRHDRHYMPPHSALSRLLRLVCILCLVQGARSTPVTDHEVSQMGRTPGTKRALRNAIHIASVQGGAKAGGTHGSVAQCPGARGPTNTD